MKSVNMTTKDIINAKVGSVALQELENDASVSVSGLAIMESTDTSSGETKEVSYLATDNGVYGSISKTVRATCELVIDAVNDNAIDLPVDMVIRKGKSKAGREYITLSIK